MPGDVHPAFGEVEAARQVLTDAEDDLRNYELHVDPIPSYSGNLGVGAMPGSATSASAPEQASFTGTSTERSYDALESQGGGEVQPPYPVSEAERVEHQEPVSRPEVANAA